MFSLNDVNKNKYTIIDSKVIEEQNLEVVEIEHKITKAKIVLLICDDENRVFNIAFKTPVNSSKGTPHILEHSVLCGSRKYNVKDPFIELAKGSMNTFLNAMTFPDKTCYPVASANLKDFHNLVDVYLDAAFYPNVVRDDRLFKQEGWHYEMDNANSNLTVNGVVYNEMKGVYSDPDSILESAILENLFNGTNYAYDYGGNPKEIINLTYDEFIEFHKKYYSPSNAIIYFYGKLDYNAELEYLENEYLKDFNYIEVDATFLDTKEIVENKEQVSFYNVDSEDNKDKAYISYSFALDKEKTSLKNIVMQIIDYVLFSSESAILKEKFLNAGFGEAVFSHYDIGLKSGMYSVIAQNISEDKKDEFVKLFISSIEDMIRNGLDIAKIKAGINSLYFTYAEGEFGRMPRGLYLTLESLESYLYGDGAYTYIEYRDAFEFLNKVDFNDKNNIFATTLKEVFLDNKHKCINVLRPKCGYSAEKDEQLAKLMSDIKSKLTNDEIDNIIREMNALKEFQKAKDSEEALKCIPMLKLSDIDECKTLIDYEFKVNEGTDTVVSFDNDRDIVYISLSFDVTKLSKEEIYLLSAINNIISKIDLKTMSFHELNNYIDINTGGLDIKIDALEDKALFTLDIKVTKDKVDYAFDIFYKLLDETIFNDDKRISILLNEIKSKSLLTLLSSGHIAAINRSKADIEFTSFVIDKAAMTGVGFNGFMNSICKVYDNNSSLINDTLDILFKKIKNSKMYLLICSNKKYYDETINSFNDFKQKIINAKLDNEFDGNAKEKLEKNIIDIKKLIPFDDFDKKSKSEAIITPNDINFCALSGTFDKKDYSGKLMVLKTLFNYEYLWTNIRVLGGAYGCMSVFNKKGFYSFVSYRDPNVATTNKTFREVKDFLLNLSKSEEETVKYIIGSIGAFDNPLSTVDKHKINIAAFFNSLTDEELNQRRKEVLNMKAKDFNDIAKLFDNIDDSNKCALICANKVEEAKKEYDSVWQLMA